MCKHLLHTVILGLDFAQNLRVGLDWNNEGQLCLHQDHKFLTYLRPSSARDLEIYSVDYNNARVFSEINVLSPPWMSSLNEKFYYFRCEPENSQMSLQTHFCV